MKINTARFGEVEVTSENTWFFSSPILGFEQYRKYVLLSQENSPFEYFQSIENEQLTFVVTDPFLFEPSYEFTLEQRWIDILRIEAEKQVFLRSIVTVRSSSDISINLKAPILMNLITKEASQIVLDHPDYKTRHLILEAVDREVSHADIVEK